MSDAPKNRHLKVSCPTCGYAVRITRKWLVTAAPTCPTHGLVLSLDTVYTKG